MAGPGQDWVRSEPITFFRDPTDPDLFSMPRYQNQPSVVHCVSRVTAARTICTVFSWTIRVFIPTYGSFRALLN